MAATEEPYRNDVTTGFPKPSAASATTWEYGAGFCEGNSIGPVGRGGATTTRSASVSSDRSTVSNAVANSASEADGLTAPIAPTRRPAVVTADAASAVSAVALLTTPTRSP